MKRWSYPLLAVVSLAAVAVAGSQSKPPMSVDTRFKLVRTFNAEKVFVKKSFPQGDKGITIRSNGEITPGDSTLARLVASKGPAARPGERAQITNVEIKDDKIVFEINGGPKKKAKWYQRIHLGTGQGSTPIAPGPDPNARGSYVALQFDKHVPELTMDEVKKMLEPVFDFGAGKSASDMYMDSLPPKVRAALQNKQVLVGMNRELVVQAKGRPDQKIRERDENQVEYEEWIFGAPPSDVEFVRFVGDEVTQVKLMKMDGTKVVRTEREIDLSKPGDAPAVAQQQPPPATPSGQKPTLRRPGEDPVESDSTKVTPPILVAPPPTDTDSGRFPGGTNPTGDPTPDKPR